MGRARAGASGAVPAHVAIIMDGNGRWAKKRNLPRSAGHMRGAKRVPDIIDEAIAWGIQYLTFFVFSHENWERPASEVDILFNIIRERMSGDLSAYTKRGICLKVMGNFDRFPADLQESFAEIEKKTAGGKTIHVCAALGYGGREDILQAVRRLRAMDADALATGAECINITEENFSRLLRPWPTPEPDLLVRTGGEKRLSNFLLWQLAYAEFYFSERFWPDFSREDFAMALEEFGERQRRYGRIHPDPSDFADTPDPMAATSKPIAG